MYKWFAVLLLGLLLWAAGGRTDPGSTAVVLTITGGIGPATTDYVTRGIRRATDEHDAEVVVLRIDTPGGLDSAMRDIVQAILASPVPIVGYVAPSGARAASAGTYIMYATHVAAMAPGTDLGAATPVQIGGPGQPAPQPEDEKPRQRDKKDDEKPDKEAKEEEKKDEKPATAPGRHPTVQDKAVREAIAYIRSLAQLRGRNAEWAEAAVREAASLSAQDALEQNVVDLMAPNLQELLKAIDGRTVTIEGREITLATAELPVVELEPDWRSELLGIITDPNVAYILMLVGIYGIIFEFYNPGMILPGTVGAISLLLALYAFNILPVNYAGLGLIVLGIALMTAEAFAPSFGILGLGGIVAFVLGSILLLDTEVPGFEVYWPMIGGIAAVSAAMFLLLTMMMLRARQRSVVSGPEEMIGSPGEVVSWDGDKGRVRAHGEIWRARAEGVLSPGTPIRVRKLDGLTLVVEPAATAPDTTGR